jgi:hypothetical protein
LSAGTQFGAQQTFGQTLGDVRFESKAKHVYAQNI